MKAKDYIISLNDKELRVLLNALGKRPFEEVYELIEKIVSHTSEHHKLEGQQTNNKKTNIK
ncbi:MAG: hypothetical protein ACK50A_03420 [Sphingobacteriaceae bacterium]|jgi:hypothetical protein